MVQIACIWIRVYSIRRLTVNFPREFFLEARCRMAKSGQLVEIERLETELEDLLNDPSVSELKSENEKLAYQIETLHRAIIQESKNYPPQGWAYIEFELLFSLCVRNHYSFYTLRLIFFVQILFLYWAWWFLIPGFWRFRKDRQIIIWIHNHDRLSFDQNDCSRITSALESVPGGSNSTSINQSKFRTKEYRDEPRKMELGECQAPKFRNRFI